MFPVRAILTTSTPLWIFGYGSLIWRPGFAYDKSLRGYIKGYKRVFYQGSTDHRGVPGAPGRVVTVEKSNDPHAVTWGMAYCIEDAVQAVETLEYLEVREKQYDVRLLVDFYTPDSDPEPAARNVLMFVGSSDPSRNANYLGPAPLNEMAEQIAKSVGPSGRNADYLFELESHFKEIGIPDAELFELASQVRVLCEKVVTTNGGFADITTGCSADTLAASQLASEL